MTLNKYRIITNDKWYIVQKRFLFFFWRDYREFCGDHYRIEFHEDEKGAREQMAYLIADDKQRKIYSQRKWKVLKK